MASVDAIVKGASAENVHGGIVQTIAAYEAHQIGVVQAADALEALFRLKGLLYDMDIAPGQVSVLTLPGPCFPSERFWILGRAQSNRRGLHLGVRLASAGPAGEAYSSAVSPGKRAPTQQSAR